MYTLSPLNQIINFNVIIEYKVGPKIIFTSEKFQICRSAKKKLHDLQDFSKEQ